jgi:prepilin-type N-terminal cleavage/methylation domain-containing protein
MKLKPKNSAFTLIELLVVISIIGILITIAVPNIATALTRAKMTETLANARSLQQATQMMTLDSQQVGSGIEWTTTMTGGAPTPVGLGVFLDALTNDGYMTKQELRKVLSAPGRQPTADGFNAGNIAFTIYAVSDTSPSDQVFVATANVVPGGAMNADATPYGNKGFVVFNKGGGGGIYKRSQDASNTNVFPQGQGGAEGGGASYTYTPIQ